MSEEDNRYPIANGAEAARARRPLLHAERILEDSTDGFVAFDSEFRFLYLNAAGERLCAISRAELLGKNQWEVFPATLGTEVERIYRQAMTERAAGVCENYYPPLKKWFEARVSPSVSGGIDVWFCDITERRRVEAALRQSEERFRRLIEASPMGVGIGDAEGAITYCNPALLRIMGCTFDEIRTRGIRWSDFTIAEFADVDDRAIQQLRATASCAPYEKAYASLDGRRVPVLVSAVAFRASEPGSHVAFVLDLTPLRETEAKLGRRARELEAILDAVPAAVFIANDPECREITANPMGYELLELPPRANASQSAPPEQRPPYRIMDGDREVPPEDLPMQKAARTGQPVRDHESEALFPDGSRRDLIGNAVPLFDEAGRPRGAVSAFIDVTKGRQALRALAESEQRLRTLYETMAQGIVYQDAEGKIAAANPAAERMLGLTLDQMQGRTSTHPGWRAIHEDGSPFPGETHPAMLALQSGATLLNVVMGVFHPLTADYTWLKIDAVPQFRPGETKPFQVYTTFDDITESRRAGQSLRASEERYRTLFETMTEGFSLHDIICDEAGTPIDYRFLVINPAFEQLTGLRREQVLGKTMNEVLPNDDPRWVRTFGEVALTGKAVHFDNYSRELKRHYDVLAFQPAPRQFAALFTDVTERRQAEQRIEQLYQEARREIARREKVELELRRSNEDLSQFAFAISHDLRSPLNAVTSFARQLKEDYQHELGEEADTYLAYIASATDRMRRLITDLLAYSRVAGEGAGEAPLIVSGEALRSAELNLHDRILETGAVITHDALPDNAAGSTLLVQLFQNLLENAMKFRAEEPPVIHVSVQRQGQEWIFCVSDNGIGIAPEHLEQVFRIFKRLHGDRYEGTGIGLAICKKIVEWHGGRLWAESGNGVGTRFCFTLPVRVAAGG